MNIIKPTGCIPRMDGPLGEAVPPFWEDEITDLTEYFSLIPSYSDSLTYPKWSLAKHRKLAPQFIV
jgi:hypothetical protein